MLILFLAPLQGYNNTQPLHLPTNSTQNTTIDAPVAALPTNIEQGYLSCLNYTIGAYVPLPYKPGSNGATGQLAMLGLAGGGSLSWVIFVFAVASWFVVVV